MMATAVLVFGLLIGSFLNVVIYRLPRREALLWGRSYCPACKTALAWRDLIPVFSYLTLVGRCRYCRAPISRRYPLVEILTSLLFVTIFYRYGYTGLTLKYFFLTALLITAAFIDLDYYIIPNELVLAGLVGGSLLNLLVRDISFSSVLVGMMVTGGFFLVVSLVSRGGMGGGDVKLAAVVGLFQGWPQGPLAAFFACFSGGLVGLGLILTGKKDSKDILPFAPFLAVGALAALWAGGPVIKWYVTNFLR